MRKHAALIRKTFIQVAAVKYYCLAFDLTVLINERLDKGKQNPVRIQLMYNDTHYITYGV